MSSLEALTLLLFPSQSDILAQTTCCTFNQKASGSPHQAYAEEQPGLLYSHPLIWLDAWLDVVPLISGPSVLTQLDNQLPPPVPSWSHQTSAPSGTDTLFHPCCYQLVLRFPHASLL